MTWLSNMAYSLEGAALFAAFVNKKHSEIDLIPPEFSVGSSKSSSYIINSSFVGETQCIFRKTDGIWTVCDKSEDGTHVNSRRLEKDTPTTLRFGDKVKLGRNFNYTYIFCKKVKLDGKDTLILEGVKKQMKETKTKENPEHQEVMDREKKGEVQEKLLQEEQASHSLDLLEEIVELEGDIQILQGTVEIMQQERIEKVLEQLAKQKSESAEKLKKLQKVIRELKGDLSLSEAKNQQMIKNLAHLAEEELQCSICCQLFDMVTTLNCGHIFCHSCIVDWMKREENCPNCRRRITSQVCSHDLDSYIDKLKIYLGI